jgi:ABC-type lipoprotein export system ATPase subunit
MNSGSIDFFDDLGTSKQEYECINLEVGGMTRLVMEMTVQDHLCLALSVSNRSLPLFFRHATIDTIAKCCESYCASLFEPLRSVFFSRIVELSSGQRQKLSCAIGLLNAKEVTLCDETTAHLDVSASDYFFRLLKGTVSQRGIVNVVVTHDIMLAAKYADRFYVIANGTVRDFDVSSCVGWESKADMLSKFIVYNS